MPSYTSIFIELVHAFLQKMGEVRNNSFIDMFEPEPNENEEIDQTTIIQHSSYYDLVNNYQL